jgi:NAD+ kinase
VANQSVSSVANQSLASVARVGVVVKPGLTRATEVVQEVAAWLQARGVEPFFEPDAGALAGPAASGRTLDHDALAAAVDLVLVLGGDGTLLATAGRIARAGVRVPILAINFGSLGFLTETTLPELYNALEAAVNGTSPIEERIMLRATIERAGEVIHESPILNDVVVTRGALSRMTDLSVSVDDQFVARFKADGLIIATATGSTAYNLSAGGPIVHPAVDAVLLTPIAPHTLTNRPVVIPATSVLTVQPLVEEGRHDVYVTLDGQTGFALSREDIVRVRRAELPLRLIRPTTRSYFEVLRQKLKWAER